MSSLATRLSERARRQIVESQLEPRDAIDRVLDFWVEQEPSNLLVVGSIPAEGAVVPHYLVSSLLTGMKPLFRFSDVVQAPALSGLACSVPYYVQNGAAM